ncbi:MAG: AraC family transcriptional regulator [Parvularcula sp.]|jgi:AraC family transcriptional regulator|nr:AraC family transcriptional regulator [Parvularcula sp.]
MTEEREIDLRFRHEREPRCNVNRTFTGKGFGIERAEMNDALTFDYSWSGKAYYLAFHDITLRDGEVRTGANDRSDLRNLRGRLTFAPHGMAIDGWSSLKGRRNSYIALTFTPALFEELESPTALSTIDHASLYFLNAGLRETFGKIDRLFLDCERPDPLMVETLGLLAVLELDRALSGRHPEPRMAGLSERQMAAVMDYVEAHLADPLTLDTMAGVAGLSRFHFARAFSASTGKSPVQLVREQRIEQACSILRHTDDNLTKVARKVGFGGPRQFANAFRRTVGVSPTEYRRSARD